MKTVQRELRRKIREGKGSYGRRMEEQLQQCNVSAVWRNLKTISGHNNSRPELARDQEWMNNLNRFFNGFDQPVTPPPTQPGLLQPPPTGTSAAISRSTPTALPAPSPQPSTVLFTAPVKGELARLKVKKATGPDGISSGLLKSCASQLCRIVEHLFNKSLRLQRVPQLWKTSCVVPVPKSSRPSDLNHY